VWWRAWLALRTTDVDRVVRALRLRTVLPANWRSGLAEVADGAVFVTPPVAGWVLAIGPVFAAREVERWLPELLERLGGSFATMAWFAADDDGERHGWARYERGELQRGYAFDGELGTTFWHGDVTAAEHALDCHVDDPRDRSDDDIKWWPDAVLVRRLAAAQSLDVTSSGPSRPAASVASVGCDQGAVAIGAAFVARLTPVGCPPSSRHGLLVPPALPWRHRPPCWLVPRSWHSAPAKGRRGCGVRCTNGPDRQFLRPRRRARLAQPTGLRGSPPHRRLRRRRLLRCGGRAHHRERTSRAGGRAQWRVGDRRLDARSAGASRPSRRSPPGSPSSCTCRCGTSASAAMAVTSSCCSCAALLAAHSPRLVIVTHQDNDVAEVLQQHAYGRCKPVFEPAGPPDLRTVGAPVPTSWWSNTRSWRTVQKRLGAFDLTLSPEELTRGRELV
jgi:hypothetical protein